MSRRMSTGETEEDEERYMKFDSERCIEVDDDEGAAGGAPALWETC